MQGPNTGVEAEADISEFRMAQGQGNAVSQSEADDFGFSNATNSYPSTAAATTAAVTATANSAAASAAAGAAVVGAAAGRGRPASLEELAALDDAALLASPVPRPRPLSAMPSPSARSLFQGVTAAEAAAAAAALTPGVSTQSEAAAAAAVGREHLDNPAALASAADRQLAAELATVCALVEREEARRGAGRGGGADHSRGVEVGLATSLVAFPRYLS